MIPDLDEDLLPEAEALIPVLVPARRSREPIDMNVKVKAEGKRIDHYLTIFFPDFSRTEFQDGIKAGSITVNGKAVKPSYKVRNDDKLHIELPEPTHDLPQPEAAPRADLPGAASSGLHRGRRCCSPCP